MASEILKMRKLYDRPFYACVYGYDDLVQYSSKTWPVSYRNKLSLKSNESNFSGCMMTSSNGYIFRVTGPLCGEFTGPVHDVQLSRAINQPLLAHHWRVHQCLLTSRFIAPSIPWGVSAPGGKMLKQLLKDHNFLNNSPILIIESSTFNIFVF